MSDVFSFRQFDVKQNVNAMKVGTDSVLLGTCASVTNSAKILDVGAGTGVISLIVAQRSAAIIDAIEINKNNWEECCYNFNASPWKNRLSALNIGFENFIPAVKYDLVISNPPYFRNSLLSGNNKRDLARHQSGLTYETFIDKSLKCLSANGTIAVILPSDSATMFIELSEIRGLRCNRSIKVIGKAGKMEKRRILELSFNELPQLQDEIVIEHEERHDYTKKYLSLVRDFLLLE